MKKLLLSLAVIGSLLTAKAQTDVPPLPTLSGPSAAFVDFLLNSSNLMVAPYGIASTDFKKFGGGIGLGYRVSEFVVPFIRLDYYDKTLFMPSASLQLQAPIRFMGKFTL